MTGPSSERTADALKARLYAALKHEKSCVCGECSGGLNAVDELVARNQQLELQRDALLAALQEQPPPSDNVFRYFQRMHGLPEIGRPADPELADSLARNQQLQEALERLLNEYDDEARDHGVPLNFALRDALRAARAALASVRARTPG